MKISASSCWLLAPPAIAQDYDKQMQIFLEPKNDNCGNSYGG